MNKKIKKIIEFIGEGLLEILLFGLIVLFLYQACWPEHKGYFIFFIILLVISWSNFHNKGE